MSWAFQASWKPRAASSGWFSSIMSGLTSLLGKSLFGTRVPGYEINTKSHHLSNLEQRLDVFFRESRADTALAIEQAVGQSTFSGLQFIHLLLDGGSGHQPVYKNRLVLPDAFRTV